MHPDDGPRDLMLQDGRNVRRAPPQAMREARVHRRERTPTRRRAPETLEEDLATKHSIPRLLPTGWALMLIASACGGGATTAPSVAATAAPAATSAGGSPAASTTALVPRTPDATKPTAAKAE